MSPTTPSQEARVRSVIATSNGIAEPDRVRVRRNDGISRIALAARPMAGRVETLVDNLPDFR
jgi:hypothetical protein